MKLFFIMISLCAEMLLAETSTSSAQIILGVFDQSKKIDFETRITPILQAEIQGCSDCVVKNYSSYDAQGNFIMDEAFAHQLELSSQEATVIFVNFNEKVSQANQVLVEAFKKAQAAGRLVVFAAGQPAENKNSAPLSQTIAGQVPKALIIGELGERDRLLGASYFGPEMLTALRPPKDQIGRGVAPAIFAGRLTKFFRKKTDWVKYLFERKLANKKIWLDLSDCFKN